MRVLVVGGTGTIGAAVVAALKAKHEVLVARRSQGPLQVDLVDKGSIERLFATAGRVRAVVCAAGDVRFGLLANLKDEDFRVGIDSKMMGQVNLVRVGADFVEDGGSFTLTTGILSHSPVPGSAAISLANAGLEGFARAAALELPRKIRVNVVSPGWVTETLIALKMDPSHGTPAEEVARTYLETLEGNATGQIFDARRKP